MVLLLNGITQISDELEKKTDEFVLLNIDVSRRNGKLST
jgi:hypothetical protein